MGGPGNCCVPLLQDADQTVNGSVGFHIPTRRRRGLAAGQAEPEIYPDVIVPPDLPRREGGLVRGWLWLTEAFKHFRSRMFKLLPIRRGGLWMFKLLRSYFSRRKKVPSVGWLPHERGLLQLLNTPRSGMKLSFSGILLG